MTDLVELIDTNTAIGKIVAGGGTATLTFREWLAFSRDELGHVAGDLMVENEAAALGKSLAELIAVADHTTVYVETEMLGSDDFQVTGYVYEIQDAPQQGMTP